MGIMTFLRNRAGLLLIGMIGLALLAFIGQEVWQQVQQGGGSSEYVGSIDGEDIAYKDFNPKVEQSLANFRQQSGSISPQMQAMAVDNAWQGEIANILLGKEYTRLGLTVSADELLDLITGERPSQLILQAFANPQTGQFDRSQLLQSLNARKTNPDLRARWLQLENQIEQQTLQQKYGNLIRNSVYVTSLEATDDYTNRNKLVSFKYVNLDYSSILDANVKLTDDDYQEYYDANKKRFENPAETRSFEYVSFSIKPTAADTAITKAQIEKLAVDFKTTLNDSLFAANNSDVKVPYAYISKGKLAPAVDSVIFNYAPGTFYGPVFSDNSFKLIKVIDSRFSPDSVKASHILFEPNKVGGIEKANKMADSVKKLIQGGGSFAAFAAQYNEDATKTKGGDLGTFSRGQMYPEFEDAVFSAKTGDLKIVKSPAGVHIVKIEKQVGSSKVAKLAYIEKGLAPSSKTRDGAYKKASAFLAEADESNFNSLAQKSGYVVGVAERLTASQGVAPGLENPRQLIREGYLADKGDVLEQVFTMDNAYIVARLTDIQPKGLLPLDAVKKQIQPAVMNAAKAKLLIERFNKALAGTSKIEAVAQKVGKAVAPVDNMVFSNPIIPGLAQENKVVGTIFGSSIGKLSAPIEGDKGVYVFVVNGFTNPAPMGNMFKQKETMVQGVGQRSLGAAFQALQDKSDIKDNRVKFY